MYKQFCFFLLLMFSISNLSSADSFSPTFSPESIDLSTLSSDENRAVHLFWKGRKKGVNISTYQEIEGAYKVVGYTKNFDELFNYLDMFEKENFLVSNVENINDVENITSDMINFSFILIPVVKNLDIQSSQFLTKQSQKIREIIENSKESGILEFDDETEEMIKTALDMGMPESEIPNFLVSIAYFSDDNTKKTNSQTNLSSSQNIDKTIQTENSPKISPQKLGSYADDIPLIESHDDIMDAFDFLNPTTSPQKNNVE